MRDDQFMYGFGKIANAMGGGGDRNQAFPSSDADDFGHGARFIPGEVTLARRRGERVKFVHQCSQCCWYWEMPDKTRIYHWECGAYEAIARHNKRDPEKDGGAGPCPRCSNPHTSGMTIKPDAVAAQTTG